MTVHLYIYSYVRTWWYKQPKFHLNVTVRIAKVQFVRVPSKNRLARNIKILQVFFLQDLAQDLAQNLAQDLAQNLANLALKMKLFLQDMKNLARILQVK